MMRDSLNKPHEWNQMLEAKACILNRIELLKTNSYVLSLFINLHDFIRMMILTGYIFHSTMNLDIIPAVTFELKMENLICLYG